MRGGGLRLGLAALVPGVQIDGVAQRLAGPVVVEVFNKELCQAMASKRAESTDVRRYHDVGASPEGMVAVERFFLDDINADAEQAPGVEEIDQGGRIDEPAARDINEDGVIAQVSEGFGVHKVVGSGGEWGDTDYDIGGGEQPRELADVPDFVNEIGLDLGVDVDSDYAHAQPFQALRHLEPDRADGDDAGGLAFEFKHSRRRLPEMSDLITKGPVHPTGDGHEEGKGGVGDWDGMAASAVGKDNAAVTENVERHPVDASAAVLHPLEVRSGGEVVGVKTTGKDHFGAGGGPQVIVGRGGDNDLVVGRRLAHQIGLFSDLRAVYNNFHGRCSRIMARG